MSKSEQSDLVSIEVHTGDASTEIFVIDGTFQLAARGVGRLETELKPGLYSIKVQAGSEAKEEHIILRPDDKHVEFEVKPLRFTSPVPLANTARTHEYHESAASYHSSERHVQVGAGSAIFVFIRAWTSDAGVETQQSKLHLARGLELREPSGNTIVDFAVKCASDYSVPDPWAACNVEVNPGLYILSLELSSGSRLEQTIVASPGWQTQIFLLQRAYGPNPEDKLADLPGASIQLSKYPHPFQTHDLETRLVELARIALAQRRVLSEEIALMLEGKYQNPMLGIYGAHLLLLESEPNLRLLETVVTNLRGLLDLHPDVEALALALEHDDSSYVFEIPPMLRRSWAHIITATITKPEIVPASSLAAIISNRVLGSELWLQWTNLSSQARASQEGRPSTTKRTEESTAFEKLLIARMASLQTDVERSPRSRSLATPAAFALATSGEAVEATNVPALNEETTAQLVQVLGMPRAAIEEMANELSGAQDE